MFNYDAIIGNEAIDFQVDKKLGKALTAIFQDVHDYKNKLDYSGVPNIDEARRKFRISSVADYFLHVSAPRLQKAVLECCNFEIQRVECFYGDVFGITGFIGMDMDIGDTDFDTIKETMARISGDRGKSMGLEAPAQLPLLIAVKTGQTDKYLKELMSVSDIFDKSNARLTSHFFSKSKRPIFARKLYIDLNAAFLSDEYISANVVEPITAEELAGIILHEIGHFMTMVEHCGDLYYMKSRINSFCANIKKTKLSQKEYKTLLDSINKVLVQGTKDKISKLPNVDNETKSKITDSLNSIGSAISNLNRDAGSESGTNFIVDILRVGIRVLDMVYNEISVIVICFVTQYIEYIVQYIQLKLLAPIMIELANRNTSNRDYRGNKSGDLGANRNRKFVLERWADEFAVRQGFGAQLATGLYKIERIIDYSRTIRSSMNLLTIRTRESWLVQALMTICLTFMKFMKLSWFCDSPIYENPYRRMLRVAQDMYVFFKNSDNVPKEVTADWLKRIKTVEETAKKEKRLIDTKPGQVFFNLIQALINPAKWFDYVNNGNLDGDLKLLEDNLDDMYSNKLFALSAKLKLSH